MLLAILPFFFDVLLACKESFNVATIRSGLLSCPRSSELGST